MSRIECEVIQDLFPSYIDDLTCEKTNAVIEEHLADCEACRNMLNSMKAAVTAIPEISAEEKTEIDFLKRNRKRNLRILIGSVAGALLMVILIIALRSFMVGRENASDWTAMNLNVAENKLNFTAVPYGNGNAIATLAFTEDDGVVTVMARIVLASPLHKGSLDGNYVSSENIKEVRIANRIIWSDGATVTALASDLYSTRHSYIGDMPANGRTANALSLATFLGAYTNELETASEPYGWKIILADEIPSDKLVQKEQDMEAFGYVIVGLIENLDHVSFVYQNEGIEKTLTITVEEASSFLGENIKNCGRNIRSLDTLIQKTGLTLDAF